MTKSKKRKPIELPPQKPSLHATASSRTTTHFDQSNHKVDGQINISGNVMDSKIVIGDNNQIYYIKRKPRIGFLIILGILSPIFTCLSALIAYVFRSLIIGGWTLSTKEIVEISSILIGIFFFSFILLAIGISRLGKATIGYVSKFKFRYYFETLTEGIKQISFYIKEYPNWFEAIKSVFWFNKKQ